MKFKRFLSNVQNPNVPHAERYHHYSCRAIENGYNAMRQEWLVHLDWLKDKVVDLPKSTPYYTQKQLQEMGIVGVYKMMALKEYIAYQIMLLRQYINALKLKLF